MGKSDQTLVIGLGRFGRALAATLGTLGHEVMGVDASLQVVQDCAPTMTHVVRADSTDVEALRQLGAADFGSAVVAIGSDIQASILTTYALVDLGIPRSGPRRSPPSTARSSSVWAHTGWSSPSATWASASRTR